MKKVDITVFCVLAGCSESSLNPFCSVNILTGVLKFSFTSDTGLTPCPVKKSDLEIKRDMESTVHPQYPVNLTRDSRLLKATYKHTNKNFKQQIINKIHGVFEYVLKQKKQNV